MTNALTDDNGIERYFVSRMRTLAAKSPRILRESNQTGKSESRVASQVGQSSTNR
ncbi:hypothetical protein [Pseudomonas sp.]|uniref:hypothetical protein n=1 Tax=Pseudomonas sp. TaxID=306 RepID=UPI002D7E510D|nr:hypothetical protein [Pseudomonas sp.]